MCTDTVEEPTIVANHYGTTCEVLQTFLQSTQGVHVNIVGRLVQKQYVRLGFQCQCQVQAVTLTTREHAALLLLVSAGEVESTKVRARVHLAPAYADIFGAFGDGLIHTLVGIDIGVHLVHITHFHGLTHSERTFVGLLHAHDHTEEGGFTRTVRANDAHNAVGWQHKVQVLEQEFIAKSFADALSIDDLVTQTWTVRDKDLQLLLALFLLLIQHSVVGSETGFTFRLAGFRCHTHPFQLALQGLATLAGLLLLHRHTSGLLLQPRRVVTLPWNTFATIQLQDPTCYIIQEIAVVGDTDDGTSVLVKVLLQPVD